MEEALRTLEDEPLKGRKIRLEKVCFAVVYAATYVLVYIVVISIIIS